jgi:hypothetical protein
MALTKIITMWQIVNQTEKIKSIGHPICLKIVRARFIDWFIENLSWKISNSFKLKIFLTLYLDVA